MPLYLKVKDLFKSNPNILHGIAVSAFSGFMFGYNTGIIPRLNL